MKEATLYKAFLTLNLASISIKIPIYSLQSDIEKITGTILPLDKIDKDCNINTRSLNFIPIIQPRCVDANYESLISQKIPAIIVINSPKSLRKDVPMYNIKLSDYYFLKKLIENPNINHSTYKLATVTIRKHEDFDTLPLILQIFLQLPPILTVIFVILLYKTFVNETDDSSTFYRYEDVSLASYNMRANNICHMCSICYEEFVSSDQIRILECEHCYHKNCIGMWLNRSNYCPMCRKNIYRGSLVSFGDITYI